MFLALQMHRPPTTVKIQWFLMYILSRFTITCNLAIKLYQLQNSSQAKQLTAKDSESVSLFPNLSVQEVTENLDRNGFCPDITISEQNVKDILEFIQKIDCFPYHDGPQNPETGLSLESDSQYKNKCSRSRYDNAFQDCPTIQALIHDSKLIKIATNYLQVPPVFMGARLWWSHADAPAYDLKRAGQAFHYDIDDYKGIRFFFYLTDVDNTSGAHVIVCGSHKHKRLRDRIAPTRFRTDQDLINFYGPESIFKLVGQAGFGFAEDPCVFHKGIPPKSQDRLMLLIRYSINDFGNCN